MAPNHRLKSQTSRKQSKANPSQVIRSSKASSSASKRSTSALQQSLVSVFSQAFPTLASTPRTLQERTQRLKQRLYARDFAAAFSETADLEAYALRWSPPRALAYRELLCSAEMQDYIYEMILEDKTTRDQARSIEGVQEVTDDLQKVDIREHGNDLRIAAFGAGPGAEMVAFAGVLAALHGKDTAEDSDEENSIDIRRMRKIRLHVVDFGAWKPVLSALESSLRASASVPPDASPAPWAALTNHMPTVDFVQRDILALSQEELTAVIDQSRLVTFFFTLNELYESSKGKTTALLLRITDLLAPGALLLVVDSPGSYATVDVGNRTTGPSPSKVESGREDKSKAYPMHWLLDHTLLEAASAPHDGAGQSKRHRWTKVFEERSRWLRLPADLQYPVPLEDMRYQAHCYQRI